MSQPVSDSWAWARCLRSCVREGQVDYARLSAQPADLDSVLADLAALPEPNDAGPARTARLINVYNALALRAGLEQYLATGGDETKARAPAEDAYEFRLYGRLVTLADVRQLLQPALEQDARVLLVLCPAAPETPLPEQPFQADLLDRQLAAGAARTVGSPRAVRVDHENRTLWVSERIAANEPLLLRWYAGRTGARGAKLLDVLLHLADDASRRDLNAAVGYRIRARAAERRLNLAVPPGPLRP